MNFANAELIKMHLDPSGFSEEPLERLPWKKMSIISAFHLLDDLITVCARRRGHVYEDPMEGGWYKGNYTAEKHAFGGGG